MYKTTNSFKKVAIAGAVSAAMLGATAAEAHVSYNLNSSLANGNAVAGPWTGGAPAGYTGNLPVTWVANVHNDVDPNAAYEVSLANAAEEYDPSTLPAGFNVETLANRWNPTRSWGNALDFGLINLGADGNLLIEVKADETQSSTFTPGFTLFSGWDTSPTSSKHGTWNVALPAVPVNPRGSAGLTYLGQASTTTAGGVTSYLFSGLSAGQYSLWIGGNGPDASPVGSQTYVANITASPVPIPAAVWLFGSALAGMGVIGRRRERSLT